MTSARPWSLNAVAVFTCSLPWTSVDHAVTSWLFLLIAFWRAVLLIAYIQLFTSDDYLGWKFLVKSQRSFFHKFDSAESQGQASLAMIASSLWHAIRTVSRKLVLCEWFWYNWYASIITVSSCVLTPIFQKQIMISFIMIQWQIMICLWYLMVHLAADQSALCHSSGPTNFEQSRFCKKNSLGYRGAFGIWPNQSKHEETTKLAPNAQVLYSTRMVAIYTKVIWKSL